MRNPAKRRAQQSELGQFITPEGVARFMASLFPASTLETCRLLDAGAGEGALLCAFLNRWQEGGFGLQRVEATAYEVDEILSSSLSENLSGYENTRVNTVTDDYITSVVGLGDWFSDKEKLEPFTHVVLNPPYRKITSSSIHGKTLKSIGLESANLYSAFITLALRQTLPQLTESLKTWKVIYIHLIRLYCRMVRNALSEFLKRTGESPFFCLLSHGIR